MYCHNELNYMHTHHQRALLHELPVHERESLPCRTQHWQLPALTGFELIASEWSADSADWRYIPTGKVVIAFIGSELLLPPLSLLL
jgi:hypothetical protein